jgi:hypothetical protein
MVHAATQAVAERHLSVQRGDFFIGFHVSGGQCYLACQFTQKLRIRFGILVRLVALSGVNYFFQRVASIKYVTEPLIVVQGWIVG